MRYALVWPDTAIGRLASAYLVARRDKRADVFRRAVDSLEADLAFNPSAEGESRSGEARIAYRLPAGLLYRVDEVARAVVILDVIYVAH